MFLEVTIFSFIFLGPVWSVDLPDVPCPDVFRYVRTTKRKEIFGEMTLDPEVFKTNSEKYEIEVKMTMVTKKAIPDAHLEFFLATEIANLVDGKESKYHVYFPTQKAIPGILSIKVNGRAICEGDYPQFKPGEVLSTLTKTMQINVNVQSVTYSTEAQGESNVIVTPAPTATTVTTHWSIEWIIHRILWFFKEINGKISSNSLLYAPIIITFLQVTLRMIWLVIQCYGY